VIRAPRERVFGVLADSPNDDVPVLVEPATSGDAAPAAALAELKRAEYEAYSPVFWRVAAAATTRHEPFLRSCLGSDDFTSFSAREDGRLVGIVVAHHRVGPPPLTTDEAWLVDDFFVARERWDEVGGPLLAAFEAQPLVVLAARRDEPKRSFLQARGYARAASWWVLPVEPSGATTEPRGFRAVTGAAPPVYDPGGPTALALALDAEHLAAYTAWAAGEGAVLAIVPARVEERGLEAALEAAGYEPASDWFAR
jgi:hypothetical protein